MNEQSEGQVAALAPRLRPRWPWMLGGLALLVIAGLVLLPYGIRYGLQRALLANGADQAQIENIDFNPFTGQLLVEQLQVDAGGMRTLLIPRASIEILWRPLLQKRAVIRGITIENTRLSIEQDAAGAWRIGGLSLHGEPQPTKVEQAPSGSPWEFAISYLNIQGSEVQYRTPQLASRLQIEAASLAELESWQQDKAAQLRLKGSINDSPLALEADVLPFAATPGFKASIKLSEFSLLPFAPLAEPDVHALDGVVALDIDLEATQRSDVIQFVQRGTVVVDHLRLGLEDAELSEEHFVWEGDFDLNMLAQNRLELRAAGRVELDQLSARQGADELHDGHWQWEGTLDFRQAVASAQLDITGRIEAADLQLQQESLKLSNAGLSWEGALGFTAAQDSGSTLQADGRLMLAGVQVTTETATVQDEQTSWQGKFNLVTRADGEKPELQVSGLLESAKLGLDLTHADQQFQLQHTGLRWEGRLDYGTAEPATDVDMEGRAELQGLALKETTQQLSLLTVQRLEAPQIRLQGLDDVRIAGLRLEDVALARVDEAAVAMTAGQGAGTLFRAREVSIDPLTLSDRNVLEIEQVLLTDIGAFVRRQPDGGLYLIDRLQALVGAADAEGDEATAGATPEDGSPTLAVRIGQFELAAGGELRFEDEGVTPPFRQTLQLDELRVSEIDTGKSQQPAQFMLKGKVGKYSRLSVQGSVVPLAPRLTLNVEAKFEAFELSPLSSYTAPALGYNLAAGTMNADSTIRITNGVIEGGNKLVINNVTVTALDDAKMQQLNAQLSMPLDAALSMLRDKNNDIHLELPVSGDVADPQFDLGDVINTALGNAMKKGAMSYLKLALQPYGTIITLAQIAGEAAARVTLDPVKFAAADSALDEEAHRYLERIAVLMKERPQLRIRVCGLATESDRATFIERALELQRQAVARQAKERAAQQPQLPEQVPSVSGVVSPTPAPSATPLISIPDEQLQELAKTRADQVKDHLVNIHAIDPERLFICLPELDPEAAATPRAMLQI